MGLYILIGGGKLNHS